ncbi:MAG: hypothetical protein M3177_00230 [Pseudomonadota bacterium]|nr:hypothetical protein [Pseudomonadota bacterium]
MMAFSALLIASALSSPQPGGAADALLAAVARGDLAAARATLDDEAVIVDSRSESFDASSLEAFAAYARDCRAGEVFREVDAEDPRRASVTVRWDCPSREASEDFIWTEGDEVVHILFGLSMER